MIKPIGITNTVAKAVNKSKPNVNNSATKERIIALIKEFEECAKGQPYNEALAKHIESLKEALKKYS